MAQLLSSECLERMRSVLVLGTYIENVARCLGLAFPTLFDFGEVGELPEAFRPTCHIFYGQRVVDMADGLPKWSGHKNASERIGV
jgi:hypothetical protein